MTIQISAFRWVPEMAHGYVKDLRLRWALGEAGLPFEVVLIDHGSGGSYLAWQPFGQVPAYRDDEVEMFETGAILLHLAERSPALAPTEPQGRAQVASWVLAALNSIETFAQVFINGDDGDFAQRMREVLHQRLGQLSEALGDKDWLVGRFSVADIAMVMVLRELVDSGVLARYPRLDALRQRGEARPAFKAALADQLAVFAAHKPGD
jgi:glutathione S-transferase